MEFSDVIKNRYSCKKFSSEQRGKDKIDDILEAGRVAPTAKNFQEQHIYVVQSESALETIDKLTPCRYNAPTVLIVAFNKNNVFTYPGEKRNSGIEDATIVATHLMLAAYNEGVDSCWINFFNPDELAKAFNLPEDEEILKARETFSKLEQKFDDEIKEFMTSPMTSKHKNSILLINQDLHELEVSDLDNDRKSKRIQRLWLAVLFG